MKLPQKPPFWKEILKENKQDVIDVLSNPEDFKIINKYNKEYYYWSEIIHRIKDFKKRNAVWAAMKLMRDDKEINCTIKEIELKYSLLPDISKKLHYFDKQLAGNISSQTNSLRLEEKYIISSLMEEAIASSIIEGAATTRKAAKEMLEKKKKPKGRAEKMVVNNYKAMESISKNKNEKLTPKLLLEIQKTVTNNTLDDKSDEGKFRDNNEILIRDSLDSDAIAHIPPDFNKIPTMIEGLCKYANEENDDFTHPIIKGIIIHFLIGYIHPFNDGNGRTARSIFYWYMLSQGYWLFEYMSVSRRIAKSRKDYDLSYLYTEYDEMDLTYFIKYNINCINDALDDLFKYIKKKQEEQKKIREIIDEKLNLNIRQMDIIRKFRQEPNKFFTIREIEGSYGVTYVTARADLLLLTKKRIITKRKAGKEYVFLLNEEF